MQEFDFTKAMKECEPQAVESLKQAMREGGPNMLKAAEIVLSYTQGKPEDKSGKSNNVTVNLVTFAQDEMGNVISSGKIIEHKAAPMPATPLIEEY